eukprot:gb/GEZJ01004946.1/.p2 GENE.gb/GEZJ01004946.1/~~gb/GEZJ01004946.1/.p2  ORF type:complete len:112 (+),score=11.17 gb/GEZJ01004946.1/:427-762(+)
MACTIFDAFETGRNMWWKAAGNGCIGRTEVMKHRVLSVSTYNLCEIPTMDMTPIHWCEYAKSFWTRHPRSEELNMGRKPGSETGRRGRGTAMFVPCVWEAGTRVTNVAHLS